MQQRRTWLFEFLLLWSATLLFWTAVFAQSATLPLHMEARGLLPQVIGWVMGSAGVASLGGRLLAGWSVQRWGTRRLMLLGGLLWAATTPLILWTEQPAWLVLARLSQGLALALFTSGAAGHVALATPEAYRGTTMGWWGLTNSLAGAAMPPLAFWLAEAVSFEVALTAGGLSAGLAALLGSVGPRRVSQPGPASNALGFTRSALLPGLLGGTLGFTAGAFIAFGPLMATKLAIGNPGLYLALSAVGTAASRLVAGPASDRWGRGIAIWPGLLLVSLAMAMQGLVTEPVPALAVPLLYGLGAGAAVPALLTWTVDRSQPQERAVAPSSFYAFYEGGIFLGPALVGALLPFGPLPAFGLPALLTAAAAATYLATAARQRSATVPTTP